MSAIQEVFRRFTPDFLKRHGANLSAQQKNALRDIAQCRTGALGGKVYYCPRCDKKVYSYHSCRNRHCPTCQNDRASQWLAKQCERLLPVSYFMVTFTLPALMRSLAFLIPSVIYDLLFRCAAAALQTLLGDPRFLGAEVAIVGLLHTWTRDLRYHPHVHFIVSGGGLSADGTQWIKADEDFLLHVFPLRNLFKGKLKAALKRAGLINQISAKVWNQNWQVHCEPVGKGISAFTYLAPYIFRVAISNHRIVKIDESHVTFVYKDRKTRKNIPCKIPGVEFIRRFLQHVLPSGFVKVRYYGLLSTTKRNRLEKARLLLPQIQQDTQPDNTQQSQQENEPTTPKCPHCNTAMIFIDEIPKKKHMTAFKRLLRSRSPPRYDRIETRVTV